MLLNVAIALFLTVLQTIRVV